MATSSADPSALATFATRTRAASHTLREKQADIHIAQAAFNGANDYGGFDASPLVTSLGKYLGQNEKESDRVAEIAKAFRAAGGSGRMRRLPDAAIEASLRASGLSGGREHVTVDEPTFHGVPPTTGYANDPVNTGSGNFVHVETDLPVPGLASGLSFNRTYNSRSTQSGAFGTGWSSWAEARLRAAQDGAEYVGPDGQRVLFPRQGEGYGRVPDVRALVEVDGDHLVLAWFGGGRWEFDDEGLPVRLDAGPGTAVQLRHDQGRLVEMSHPAGRRLSLVWRGDRIVALTSSDGRRVEYDVDDSGTLMAVRGPERTCRYGFTPDGRIATITDADGVTEIQNEYDDQGRVTAQVSNFGRRTEFSYLPGGVTVTDDETGETANTWLHDAKGRLIGVIDAHGSRQSMSYDAWGNRVIVTTRSGATLVSQYDERCRRTRTVLATGAEFGFAYDEHDRVVEVTSSTGAVVRYRYDGQERIPSETVDAAGGVTRLRVEAGVLKEVVDPDGVRLQLDVDADGEVVAVTDALGQTARLQRDAVGRVTTAISPLGRRTKYTYDAAGLLATRTDPSGGIWRYEYTDAGRPLAVVDPLGARTEVDYGDHGAPERLTDALGQTTTRRYDLFGHVVGLSGADGTKWEFGYDGLDRLTAVNDPSGGTWLREYDVDGNLVASVDPVGTRRTATWDAAGLVTAVDDGLTSAAFASDPLGRTLSHTRPDGTRLQAEYDLAGRVTQLTDPEGGTTTFAYTAAGRLRSTTSPTGRIETYEYDERGRLAARVDAAGRRWTAAYDADGAVVEQRAPSGTATSYVYDRAGRLTRSTSPERGTVRYTHDLLGRVVEIIDRVFGRRRFSYDSAGRVVAATDARGGRTEYGYDVAGRLLTVTDPLGATTTRSYDEVGRLVAVTDPLGRTSRLSYDAAGRLVEQSEATGNTTRWAYDTSGRVTSYGPADGSAPTVLHRDALGRVTDVEEPEFTHELRWDRNGRLVERRRGSLAVGWRYDADGRRAALRLPDGSQCDYEYDTAGRLAGVSHPATGRTQLARDEDGRVVEVQGDGGTTRWVYQQGVLVARETVRNQQREVTRLLRDALGRLSAVDTDGTVEEYGYDEAGQLVSVRAAAAETRFEYDAAGRLVREDCAAGERRYEYDLAAQLVASWALDGTRTRFTYDAAGRRTREQTGDHSRLFRWDAAGRLAGVEDSRHGTTAVRVDALGELAQVGGTGLLWDTADPLSPLLWLGDTAVAHAGPATALAGPSGVEWSLADGSALTGVGRDVWGAPATPGSAPQLGPGGELEFAGLSWLRARAYDPNTRALLSPDPLPPVPGAAWAGNPYAYAGNDPVGSADPLGLRPVTDAELRAYQDQVGKNVFQQAGDWIAENKEMIVAGALIVGGIAVMATGVGGPIGAAMIGGALLSAGGSAAVQQMTTGNVDWGQVAVAGVIGAASGGLGAGAGLAASNAGRVAAMSPVMRGAVVGGADNIVGGALNRAAHGENPLDPRGIAVDLLSGGGAGSVGGRLGMGGLARADDSSGTELVTLYRGTSNASELEIHRETGLLMSDAARIGYVQSEGSIPAAAAASEAAHRAALRAWGTESEYVEAHGAFGGEMSEIGPRSMLSLTSDPDTAKYFAGPDGRVFEIEVSRDSLLPQTLPGATESEYLVRHMVRAQ